MGVRPIAPQKAPRPTSIPGGPLTPGADYGPLMRASDATFRPSPEDAQRSAENLRRMRALTPALKLRRAELLLMSREQLLAELPAMVVAARRRP